MREKGKDEKLIRSSVETALIGIMQKKAFEKITIMEISQKTGIGRTTFYRYYSTASPKEEILFYHAYALWAAYSKRHPEEVKKDAGKALFRWIYEDRAFFTLLHRQNLTELLFRIFYHAMVPQEGEEPLKLFMAALAGASFGIAYQWIQDGFHQSPDEISAGLKDMKGKRDK